MIRKLAVISMNVEKLYPSMVASGVSRVVRKKFLAAELGVHLAVKIKREELVRRGYGEVTHTRISTGGSSQGITTAEVVSRGEKIKSKVHPPARVCNKEEQRLRLALILEILYLQ